MIIKPSKFEAVIFCTALIIVSFFFAMTNEVKSTPASLNTQSTEIPIIMYHHMTAEKSRVGKYTVHVNEFESDLKYLKENGFETVTVSDLIAYTEGNGTLPIKPIMITFDDGFESFYSLAFPLLKEYRMKAVMSVIGSVSQEYSDKNDHNINYSNLNFAQIKELSESGFVEIQNHSYNMHQYESGKRKGISKLKSESTQEYSQHLSSDLTKNQQVLKENCGIEPQCMVYPYGAYSKETLPIIKELGFKATLLCEERLNTVTIGNPESLYGLGRFNREGGAKTETFFNRIYPDQESALLKAS